MENFKLIRKICLFLSAFFGGAFFIYYVPNQGQQAINYGHSEYIFYAALLVVGQFIGFVIFFKIISKIIESVNKIKNNSKNLKIFTDKKYLEAYSEVEENNIQNKELWAKAFAQCGGDKEKQKSIYVELRTKELSKR
jgi:hypothetical protein